MLLQSCRFKNMFEIIIEHMVLHQRNFVAFSYHFSFSNEFLARSGFGLDQVSPFTILLCVMWKTSTGVCFTMTYTGQKDINFESAGLESNKPNFSK